MGEPARYDIYIKFYTFVLTTVYQRDRQYTYIM